MRELKGKRKKGSIPEETDQKQPVEDLNYRNCPNQTHHRTRLNRQSRETMEGSNRVRWKALVEAFSSQAK